MSAHLINSSLKKTLLHGFTAGIGWAFGATIGFAILIGILSYIFSYLDTIPYIKNIVRPVSNIVENPIADPREQIIQKNIPIISQPQIDK